MEGSTDLHQGRLRSRPSFVSMRIPSETGRSSPQGASRLRRGPPGDGEGVTVGRTGGRPSAGRDVMAMGWIRPVRPGRPMGRDGAWAAVARRGRHDASMRTQCQPPSGYPWASVGLPLYRRVGFCNHLSMPVEQIVVTCL